MRRICISPDVALRYVTCRTCGNVLAVRASTERGQELIRCRICRRKDIYHFVKLGFHADPDEDDEDDEDETEEDEREEIRA